MENNKTSCDYCQCRVCINDNCPAPCKAQFPCGFAVATCKDFISPETINQAIDEITRRPVVLGGEIKVKNMVGHSGREIPNQFVITTKEGEFFQSYSSIILFRPFGWTKKKVQLDRYFWDYSCTTGKYRNIFLSEPKRETEKKIKAGIYELADLNGGGNNAD